MSGDCVRADEPVQTTLPHAGLVVACLREATRALGAAHAAAGEQEGDRDNLNGPVRDALFGLNTAVEALASMIEEGRFNG